MKPVTVHAGVVTRITELQEQGLDHIVDYLTKALTPGALLPLTARIVIEWGDEEALTILREKDYYGNK